MGNKRVVDPMFWDNKVVAEKMTRDEKYFFLFLITNPELRQLGIYNLPISKASYYSGFTAEEVRGFLKKFQDEYLFIRYNDDTNEIAIRNYLRHGVVSGGDGLTSCLTADANNVKDKSLLRYIKEEYDNSSGNENKTVELFMYDIENFYGEGEADYCDEDYRGY